MGEWISAKDRLPEKYEDVLVYMDTISLSKMHTAYIGDDGKWRVVFDEDIVIDDDEYYDVAYWMPLPEPPEVEQ